MTFHSRKSTKVRQNGHTLVAAYHNANPPLIWKFDLERNHSFTLALQGEDGDWELGVTTPKEEFHPVARFASREDAEEAFAKTQRALLCGKRNIWKMISFLLIAILLFLYVIMPIGSYFLRAVSRPALANLPAGSTVYTPPTMPTRPLPTTSPTLQDGIPLPADQVLKPPS